MIHSSTRRISLAATLALTLALSGCGGDSSANLNNAFLTAGASQESVNSVAGRVFLGGAVANAQVKAFAGGKLVASTTTRPDGSFTLPGNLPARLHLEATLSSGLKFSAEVSQTRWVVINVPSTLVSDALASTPNADPAEMEERVRKLLGIPATTSLKLHEESVSFGFSHAAFFSRAALQGGWQGYRQVLLGLLSDADVQKLPGSPFLLRGPIMKASLSGLEPELQGLVRRVQVDPRQLLATQLPLSRGFDNLALGVPVPQPVQPRALVLAAEGGSSIASSLLDSVAEGVGSSLRDVGVDTLYSWVAEQLGWHFGTTVTLQAILGDVQQVQAGIGQIKIDIDETNYKNAAQALQPKINEINTQTTNEVNALTAFNSTNPPAQLPNQPADNTDPQINYFLSQIASVVTASNVTADLQLIQEYMTGAPSNTPPILVSGGSLGTNMIGMATNITLNDNYGIGYGGGTANWGNFPVRSSAYLDQVLQTYEFYAQYQILAANVLAEAAHTSTSPASAINEANAAINNAAISLLSQRAQVPQYPPSDKIWIDLQYGLMWNLDLQAATDINTANNNANKYELPLSNGQTYTDWRFPSFNECKALQQRGLYASGGSDYGNVVDGLKTLGFNLDGINDDGDIWFYNWYDTPGVGWNFNFPIDEFRFNHETNNNGATSSDRPYLLVRSIIKPLIKIDAPESGLGPSDSWPDAMTPDPVTEQDAPFLGTAVGITSVSKSDSAGQVYAQAVYQVNVGSSAFTLGNTGNTGSGSTDLTASTSKTCSLLPFPYCSTDNSNLMTISNLPQSWGRLIWHSFSGTFNVKAIVSSVGLSGGNFPVPISNSIGWQKNSPVPQLKVIQVSPRNNVFHMEGGGVISLTQQFVATGFYSDKSAQNLTGDVVWSVVDTATNTTTPGATFSNQTKGLLVLDKSQNLTVSNLTVTATLNSPTTQTAGNVDSTLIEVSF